MADESTLALIDSAAGFIAGAVVTIVFQPFDSILTQNQYHRRSAGAAVNALLAKGGGPALWRGTLPALALVPLQNALLMTGYGFGARFGGSRADDEPERAAPRKALAPVFFGGCAGGLAQSFVASPFELAKVRRQLFASAPGASAATRGLAATFYRDVVPHGVWFVAYDVARAALDDPDDPGAAAPPLAGGAFAAALAWLVGYPFDLLKTRIQGSPTPVSLADATRAVLRDAGPGPSGAVLALYRGFALKLLRAVPSNSLNFYVYEAARRRLAAAAAHLY